MTSRASTPKGRQRDAEPRFAESKDGTRIAYWMSGRGKAVVLVHGTTADHTRWDAMRPLLEPHVTVVAMDRRGRGGSGDAEAYALAREAEDVSAVVDAVAEEHEGPVCLFGHSFGALCALEAALLTPNVRRLVLYEPVVMEHPPSRGFAERADALIAQGKRDETVELFFRAFLGADDAQVASWRAQPSWSIRVTAAHTLAREDRAERTYRLDKKRFLFLATPTALLSGTNSDGFLKESTDAVALVLPDARILPLQDQEHFAIVSAPQLVADVVLPFLRKR